MLILSLVGFYPAGVLVIYYVFLISRTVHTVKFNFRYSKKYLLNYAQLFFYNSCKEAYVESCIQLSNLRYEN